jgi:hypothetical protein
MKDKYYRRYILNVPRLVKFRYKKWNSCSAGQRVWQYFLLGRGFLFGKEKSTVEVWCCEKQDRINLMP